MVCKFCRALSPRMDFNNRCCRVRFLVRLPSQQDRKCWLERFAVAYGQASVDADSQAGKAVYELKKIHSLGDALAKILGE